jgi:hypothetical protein
MANKRRINPEQINRIIAASPIQDTQAIKNVEISSDLDESTTSRLVHKLPRFALELLRKRGLKFSSFAKEAIYEKMVKDGIVGEGDQEGKHPFFAHRLRNK